MSTTTFTRDDANAKLTIERVFSASCDRVWHALTDAALLDQWWAPRPWKTTTVSMDFRVGGFWLYFMQGPEGDKHYARMDYLGIEVGSRYVAQDCFCDAEGRPNVSLPVQKFETSVHADGDRTRVLTIVEYRSLEDLETVLRMGMQEGLTMAHDQLEALLAS